MRRSSCSRGNLSVRNFEDWIDVLELSNWERWGVVAASGGKGRGGRLWTLGGLETKGWLRGLCSRRSEGGGP